ncbi:MAG: dUTP diphosphatase [Thermoleophilia bacterium]
MDDLPVQRVHPAAVVPRRAHPWDAGLDLVGVAALHLAPGARGVVPTGLVVAIPEGWAGLVVPRSGMAMRLGVSVTNTPGLIDAGYRGELRVLLVNHGDEPVDIAAGERVAQLVLVPVWTGAVLETDRLPASDGREAGGFGSSGA